MAVADDLDRTSSPEFDRQPPQDFAAEQSVLGGMLLSKDAIADVIETLKGADFYRPAHQLVYDTIVDLYARGEPADPVTVSSALGKSGNLLRVGGAPYLHTLISSVPTAANAGYYATIVAERAILRRLVEAGTRIVQLGYGAASGRGGEVDEIVDRAQAEVYDVTERRMSEDYVVLEKLLQGTMDEIDAISSRGGVPLGVKTGFEELDEKTHGLHPGQLVLVAARPALGKSTLALDIARNCSIKLGLASVIFSLEMSKSEITMRLLSAEAKVPLHHMRSGNLNDGDWTKLGRRMGEVADAPLYIDDSPNLTMMEIRAKSRRLKQRHDLRLVIVDYLQLMTSGRKVESRQQEVSEFSRQLKLLAKELDVPVIAVCQLNRGPEQRQDKKPMLADLRESGCLPASTRILRADTGAEVTIGSLFTAGERDVPVWSLDDRLRLVPRTMTHAFSSGVKDVFRLRLTSGREVDATANHPFLTVDGWLPLRELTVGSRVGVPRHVPAPQNSGTSFDERVVALADAVGRDSKRPGAMPAIQPEVFSLGTRQVRLFLRELWNAGGVTSWDEPSKTCRITFDSAQRRVLDDLARLLLRCNVLANIHPGRARGSAGWRLSISQPEQQLRFLTKVGGGRDAAIAAKGLQSSTTAKNELTIPEQVWTEVHGIVAAEPRLLSAIADEVFGAGARTMTRSRERLGRLAAVLDDAAIDIVATNDIFWDAVAEITPLGEQETYDATVPGTHNFVANGIAVHNSLEQDADLVLLIHREDFYEPESPRAGEADLLVVKHR
ncbi:MAG: replicative DNA helicase, partial [Actinomycetota bacterium]|nr:replicative DNA helicase [Actinomycetota bacterium]